MFPIASTNHHTHIEPGWKTYYDAKKLLRQTEQRLKDAREYYPHVHFNTHHDSPDLSNLSSSSFLLHPETSSIHAGNRSMLNDERAVNTKHQLLDSEALQTIRRKINKQKIAAERRAEQLFHSQSDAGHMFESYRPHSTYSTSASLQNLHYSPQRQQRFSPPKPQATYSSHLSQSQSFPSELDTVLRHSASSRILHRENEIERQSFHPSTTRKMATVIPKDSYSLPNGQSSQQRSTNASTKYPDLPSTHLLTPSSAQRLKHIRRVESAHIPSGSGPKTNLITPDSWRTEPVVTKKSSSIAQQEKLAKKKTTIEIISKRTKTDLEEPLTLSNQGQEKLLKPKRDTNASKPSVITTEKTPLKPPPPPPPPSSSSKPKSDDEKKKLQEYIEQKRQQQEEISSNEKRFKDEQEKGRKEKIKKLNEPIKDVPHQYLPAPLPKRTSAFTPIAPTDLTEQTRQRLLRLLGPSIDYSLEQTSVRHRSPSSSSSSSLSSSSSSSNDSVIEIQPSRSTQLTTRSRSEPPFENISISDNLQRHENLLRWAVNLTKDCDIVENRFKYLRPDGTQTFDFIPIVSEHLQHDGGNLRSTDLIKSRSTNGRLNHNRSADYQTSTVIDHRDFSSERRIHRDRAAAKIQAAYRGYSVRKSLPRLNEKPKVHDNDFNRRPIYHRENASINIELRSTNNLPVDSTLLHYYESQPIDDFQQPTIRKTILPAYSDDYDNVPNVPVSNLSTPINLKQIPIIHSNRSLDIASTNSSTSTTPIPSPEPHVPSQMERRRSISPPLLPQMSPDNGRPLQHLTQSSSRRSVDENIESIQRPKSSSRTQTIPSEPLPPPQTRKSPTRQSTSTNRKRRSPSPQAQQSTTLSNTHSRHRTPQNSSPPTSSSESILTAREKRVRQKFNTDIELQAYEKRLKDIEKKIRQLVKRAFEIFDEKRTISTSPTVVRESKADKITNYQLDESSISEEGAPPRNDSELTKKDSDTSSISTGQRHSDVLTSDASDLERRVRAYRDQLKAKKNELERLKQRKNKEILRRQEDELKKQIESYDHEIQTLRLQPVQQEQTVPVPSISDSSSSVEKTKSTVPIAANAEEIDVFEKVEEIDSRPIETPRDERDTQHDAQSISVISDLPNESEADHHSRRESVDNDQPIIDFNVNLFMPEQEQEESPFLSSSSSSSKTSEKSPSPQVSKSPSSESSQSPSPPPLVEQRAQSPSPPPIQQPIKSPSPPPVPEPIKSSSPTPIPIQELTQIQPVPTPNEYDEDFSELSHSPINTPTKPAIVDLDIESIPDDIDDKPSLHDTNQSSASKSSADEQSAILVLGKNSPNNTPRQQEETTLEEELPPATPPPASVPLPTKTESDDTSHDISEGEDRTEQETKIDQLTENFLQTFIGEAIDHGKEIETMKAKTSVTKEAKEWISDDDSTDEETNKKPPTTNEEDVDNAIQKLSTQPEFLELLDPPTNGVNESEVLKIDLSRLDDDRNPDEPRIESPRRPIVEEPLKPVVSHTREQVIQLCHEALIILYNQNTDFSTRSTINRTISDSYFNLDQEDTENADIQRNRHAYCRMIFDLCTELLHEMYSPTIRLAPYPEWQRTKLISKRFYRLHPPKSRVEAENFIQQKLLEILNLHPRQIIYSKWRKSIIRHPETEQFELVLDEELRRTENQWIDYEDDCTRIKFDIAEYLFDQLVQETLTECFHVINKRVLLSSNSTRL